VRGQLPEAERICKDILDKINQAKAGYEGVSGRTAAYILAYTNQNFYHNNLVAKQYYNQSMEFARQTNATNAGYYWSSLLNLGRIADAEKDTDLAQNYYKQVIEAADRKSSQYKEAKKFIEEGRKARRDERRKR
jgi:hypothetical protein